MAKVDYTDVVEALSRLQLNYTSLASQLYNIFFNPIPMDVTLVFMNESGEEVEITIPNRAKDQKYITNGEGSPVTSLQPADIGTIYQDITNGEVYIKYGSDNSDWSLLISKNELDSYIQQGQGVPTHTAAKGTLFVDTQNGHMYMQRTSTGNGWEIIDAYPTGKITETFTFDHTVNSIILDGICENKDVLSIYEDGVKLNPTNYDMPYGDNKTIILRKPINTPVEGQTVEVIVEYYTDLHVTTSSAENELVQYVKEGRFFAEGGSPREYNLHYLGDVDEMYVPEDIHYVDVLPSGGGSGVYVVNSDPSTYWIYSEGNWITRTYLPTDTSNFEDGDYYYCVLEDSMCIWKDDSWKVEHSAKFYRNDTQAIRDGAEYDIAQAEEAIDQAGQRAEARFSTLYNECYNTYVETKEYIDQNYAVFSDGVNRVDNYAQEVARDRNAVDIMMNNVHQMEQNTYNYFTYVESKANDFALKTDFQAFQTDVEDELNTISETLNNEMQSVQNILTDKINEVNSTLTTELEDEISDRIKADTKLQGTIDYNQSTFENWTASHSDLGDFTNNAEYFNRLTQPIDLNGIYKYSTDITTLGESSSEVQISVVKDCSYYSVDVGKYMENVTGGDANITFTITPNRESIDFSLPDKMGNGEYTKDFSNVVCAIRCLIKNETSYKPTIKWDITKITWLGEEPELDANKSYIIEFVSYDMMTSWKAHVLGICQPAIDLDTFSTVFTIHSNKLATDDSAMGSTSEVRLVAIIDGMELTMDDVYDFDIASKEFTSNVEIERKFIGKTLSEVQLKSVNTPAFKRYYAGNLGITLTQNSSHTISLETMKEISAGYCINVTSDAIEEYMRGGLSIDDYFAYPAQQEAEAVEGAVIFVDRLPVNKGTVAEYEDLPVNAELNDYYTVEENGETYMWNGSSWGSLSNLSALYVLNSNPEIYWTWYPSMEEWKSSKRIVPSGSFLTQLNVTGRFVFDYGNIAANDNVTSTYYYNPTGNINDNGAKFLFNASSGVMPDPLVVKPEDNHVTNIRVRYNEMTAGECYSAQDKLTVTTGTEDNPATVYISTETVSQWEV